MVVKKAHSVIPAHLVAEAISTLNGLDLRWSGPITPSEMQYVRHSGTRECSTSFHGGLSSDLDKTQLEPSRLLDILTKKTSFRGNFMSIPEIQAQNRALKHCGLNETEYVVLFMPCYKDAMVMTGESYPFFRGNYYMTIIDHQTDLIKEFASRRESKVLSMPENWLDLRIKGSQLSQHFRRKCKHVPKGLFSYPVMVNGTRYSLHWISEAHRNSWHVLIDPTGLSFGKERLALALHRPDFVLCTLENVHGQPSKVTCLLMRRKSFETTSFLS
ncbi:hypothetical protein HS088_TW06G00606 [Tripterygium wilfordii]|uniref:Molybdenum cofactor sulfurase n=1 Tax=Tripterygium wilfordii TaxID=458696 RepID=A0A7J7DJ94_TRIWF|nr:hypothetical protein HS088_TW06G00606 [Tripterygium wilfordii]